MFSLFGNSKTTDCKAEATFYMVDSDPDASGSLLNAIIRSKNDAFDKPSILCELIDKVPKEVRIKIILNTNGGRASHCEKILRKLLKHPAGYTAYVRKECYSAGTFIALGAREIVMTGDSYLGKCDIQLGDEQMQIYEKLEDKYITADNIYKVKLAKYLRNYDDQLLDLIFQDKLRLAQDEETKADIAKSKKLVTEHLIDSELPHIKIYDNVSCQEMLLPVREPTEEETKFFTDKQKVKDYLLI